MASGGCLSSFVDSHTHLVFAASREEGFVMKIKGATYAATVARWRIGSSFYLHYRILLRLAANTRCVCESTKLGKTTFRTHQFFTCLKRSERFHFFHSRDSNHRTAQIRVGEEGNSPIALRREIWDDSLIVRGPWYEWWESLAMQEGFYLPNDLLYNQGSC